MRTFRWLFCVAVLAAACVCWGQYAPPTDVLPQGGGWVVAPGELRILDSPAQDPDPEEPSMAITIGAVYSTEIASGSGSGTWTITGIAVPNDATACIAIAMGYRQASGQTDPWDISNFDEDSDDLFTHIVYAHDGNGTSCSAIQLLYGATGFPSRGATNQTFTGSFTNNVSYGACKVILFFLSGTVTDATFVIGTDHISNSLGAVSTWTSDSLGTLAAADVGFIAGSNYQGTLDASDGDQVHLIQGDDGGSVYWAAGYEAGQATPKIDATTGGDFYFEALIAFAVKAAAGGGTKGGIMLMMDHFNGGTFHQVEG